MMPIFIPNQRFSRSQLQFDGKNTTFLSFASYLLPRILLFSTKTSAFAIEMLQKQ